MKKILILLILASNFKAQSNGVWCISHDNNLYNLDKETNQLTDLYWDPIECYATQYKALENDDQVAAICKKTPKRPGCFDKNKHGQVFCEAFKEHHKKDLEGGTCTAREWDTWKNEKAYLKVDVTADSGFKVTEEMKRIALNPTYKEHENGDRKRINEQIKQARKDFQHSAERQLDKHNLDKQCREKCNTHNVIFDHAHETEEGDKDLRVTTSKTMTLLCHCEPNEEQLKRYEEQLRR